ncbi:MAG: alkaline phosphatase [Lentisphaeria bacterium]|nr:alkaline phosphatase [Lentisphaeria bacterium]
MKRFVSVLVILFAALSLCAQSPKYVFLFIGDGMSTPQRMIADEFARQQGHGQLTLNTLKYHATTRTCSANSLVTDSAAAATAIACGEKTNNGRIGMDSAGTRRLESVAEAAQKTGRKIGIITSVTINHATPAGFYAHRKSRSQYYAIGLDLIASGFDYFGGGGVANADDKKAPEYKGASIYKLAEQAGYKVVCTKKDLLALKPGCGKVLARGSDGNLPYAIDADGSTATLAEFTAKGIELLDNPKGFFMMIEGGAIDWCGHANEAAGNLGEVLALDEAVRVAVKFAEKHPKETLIVVTGDHETGGMTMGFAGTGYALYMERLANQKCSVGKFKQKLAAVQKANPAFSFEDAKKMLTADFGFQFSGKGPMVLSAKEIAQLEKAFKNNNLGNEARIVMNAKAGIGWTSGSHTALPVLTTSSGVGAEIFTGFLDNTDIAKKLKSLF